MSAEIIQIEPYLKSKRLDEAYLSAIERQDIDTQLLINKINSWLENDFNKPKIELVKPEDK